VDTAIPGFTGSEYLVYRGTNLFNSPGHSRLTYQLQINQTGKYRIQWRSRIALGSDQTEHNDSWLRLPDASSFYAQKSGNVLYPHGSGRSPNPVGAGSKGWFKVYQNQLGVWSWNTSTNDHNPFNIFAEFDSAGTYTLEVSGRSLGHALDRIVLYHESVAAAQALNLNLPESPRSVFTSLPEEAANLVLFPNPVQTELVLLLPVSRSGDEVTLSVKDMTGKVVKTFYPYSARDGRVRLPVKDIPSGIYILVMQTGDSLYREKFIKR
jgi:hypothetical protein